MALEPTVRHENGDFCGGGVNSRTWTSTVADGVLGGVSTTTRVSRDEHSQVLLCCFFPSVLRIRQFKLLQPMCNMVEKLLD